MKKCTAAPRSRMYLPHYFFLGDEEFYFHRTMSHLKFLWCEVKNRDSFFFRVDIQLTQHILLKTTSFPPLPVVSLSYKSIDQIYLGFVT